MTAWLKDRMYGDQLIIQGMRIGLYGVLALLALASFFSSEYFYNWELNRDFYAFAGLGLVLGIAGLFLPARLYRQSAVLAGTFAIDVLLIGYLVAQSHLNATLLFFCSLLLIMAAGLALGRAGAFAVALVASIGTSASLLMGPELKTLNFFFQLLLSNLGFLMVAFLAGYFADQLRNQGFSLLSLRQMNQIIVDALPAGILTVLPEGQVLTTNPGGLALFGLQENEATHLRDFFPELGELAEKRQEIHIQRNGEALHLRVQVIPRSVGPQKTFIVLIEDLTQVKRLEFAMQQSEKLAAVGQLAAGIAHEIRNPLTGISGSIELLSQHSQTEEDRKLSRIILKEIDRLNNLITEFLDFAKPEKPPTDVIDLAQVVRETVDSLRLDQNNGGGKIAWTVRAPAGATIRAHRDKLKQAIVNIVVNSMQAVKDKPEPKIEARITELNGELELAIEDNGNGMSERTRQKMFEPFHTTKAKGTGLGLAITLKIIESHQGKIFVESQEGVGTTFSVRLKKV